MRFGSATRGLFAAALCAHALACGSSASGESATVDSGSPSTQARMDAGVTPARDASPDSRLASPPGQDPAPDSGAPHAGDAAIGGSYVCWRDDSAQDCFDCCMGFFPAAQQKLLAASASCTCTPSQCGPGGDAGDGGACGADMCSLDAGPSNACVECVLGALEGANGPPLCPASAAACNQDPDCASLLACGANCPGTTMD